MADNWWSGDQVVRSTPVGVALGDQEPGYAIKGPKAQADLGSTQAGTARTQTQTDLDKAKVPYASAQAQADAAKAAADAEKAHAEAQIAQQTAAQGGGANRISAETRAQAISGFNSSRQLSDIVSNLRDLYSKGPGATHGIYGVEDYFPSVINKRFDTAGNAARGIVGQALGFTGGQLNTEKEAESSVGPYLPQAGDRDEVIVDKINRLEDLAGRARSRAVAQLGGEPDQNGNIHQIGAAGGAIPAPAAGGLPPAGGPGAPNAGSLPPGLQGPSSAPQAQTSLATGPTRIEQDPKAAALINTLVRRGASADEINAAISPLGFGQDSPADVTAAQSYLKTHPNYTGSLGGAQRAVPTTAFNRLAASPLGSFAIGAGDAATAGNMDSIAGALGGDPNAVRQGLRLSESANPTASLLGSVAGGAASAGVAEAGLGALAGRTTGAAARLLANPLTADVGYGAAYGAGSNDDDRLTGAVTGGIGGAVGGMFGRGLTSGASRALRGVGDADVSALTARGVPLTVGQALGGAAKGIEDRLTGLPVIGDLVNARRREGFQGFNRAAFDEALAPINATTGGVTGEAGIDLARNARSNAYSAALDNVNLTRDGDFDADYLSAQAGAGRLPADMGNRATFNLDRAEENIDPTGNLTGRDYQQAIRRLRREAGLNANLPNGHDFGQVMQQGEDAFQGLVQRQSPQTIPAYDAANAANRNVEVLRDAVNRGRSGTRVGEPGLFAPSQLSDAAAANSRRFGNSQGTTNQPFFDLTRAGQRVLPSVVPDSGTAGRLALLALPSALGGTGAGAGYLAGDTGAGTETGLGIGALLALGGTRRGQQILTRALLDRPGAMVGLGNRVQRYRGALGMFGAGAGATLPAVLK